MLRRRSGIPRCTLGAEPLCNVADELYAGRSGPLLNAEAVGGPVACASPFRLRSNRSVLPCAPYPA